MVSNRTYAASYYSKVHTWWSEKKQSYQPSKIPRESPYLYVPLFYSHLSPLLLFCIIYPLTNFKLQHSLEQQSKTEIQAIYYLN